MNTPKKQIREAAVFCRTTPDLKKAIQMYAEKESRSFSSAVEYLLKKALNV